MPALWRPRAPECADWRGEQDWLTDCLLIRNIGPSLPSSTGLRSPVHCCPSEIAGPPLGLTTTARLQTNIHKSADNLGTTDLTDVNTLQIPPRVRLVDGCRQRRDEVWGSTFCLLTREGGCFSSVFELQQDICYPSLCSLNKTFTLFKWEVILRTPCCGNWEARCSEMFYVNIVNIKTSRETFLTSWHRLQRSHSEI